MKMTQKTADRIFDTFNTIFMLFVMAIMLYPMLNTLAISFNDATDSLRGGIYLWPRNFTIENYIHVFENPVLLIAFRNSVLRTLISTSLGVFICAMAGYVVSRKDFIFQKAVTIYFLVTLYVTAGLLPTFFLFRDLGLVNTFHVYWVPGLFGAFNVIVIRAFMQGLPESLTEAAEIDGASQFRTFIQIVLPLCKPVLATVGLWIAVGNWNDWFTTFVFITPANQVRLTVLQFELHRVLATAMAQMSAQQAGFAAQAAAGSGGAFQQITPIAVRSTITIVATLPILFIYPFLQKYFVKGVHLGSVKG